MMALSRCPSPTDLERAFWSAEEDLDAHVHACSRCRVTWAEIAALVELGRALPQPPPPSPAQRLQMRANLLSVGGAGSVQAGVPWWRRWSVAVPLVAAAACAILWWAWPAEVVGPTLVNRRGRLLDHPGARYLVVAAQPDEIIRLIEGTISVEVDHLGPGERFRVLTGDAEVEVKGTAFDVTSRDDRLAAVRVIKGRVEVRGRVPGPQTLGPGQSWTVPLAGSSSSPTPGQPNPGGIRPARRKTGPA